MSNPKVWELIHDLNRKDLRDALSLKEFLDNFNSKLESMFKTNWSEFVKEQLGGDE